MGWSCRALLCSAAASEYGGTRALRPASDSRYPMGSNALGRGKEGRGVEAGPGTEGELSQPSAEPVVAQGGVVAFL